MFRPMRRASRAIPEEAAKHLLQQSRRGVLAVNGDNGYPFAIPVNYCYDQEHTKSTSTVQSPARRWTR